MADYMHLHAVHVCLGQSLYNPGVTGAEAGGTEGDDEK